MSSHEDHPGCEFNKLKAQYLPNWANSITWTNDIMKMLCEHLPFATSSQKMNHIYAIEDILYEWMRIFDNAESRLKHNEYHKRIFDYIEKVIKHEESNVQRSDKEHTNESTSSSSGN